MKTLTEMLASAKRESQLRKNVYPRWVESGRLDSEKAKHEIECMEAICVVLDRCLMLEQVSEEMKAMERKRQPAPQTPDLPL